MKKKKRKLYDIDGKTVSIPSTNPFHDYLKKTNTFSITKDKKKTIPRKKKYKTLD